MSHQGRGAAQAENSPRLKWATQILTAAYGGAYSAQTSNRIA